MEKRGEALSLMEVLVAVPDPAQRPWAAPSIGSCSGLGGVCHVVWGPKSLRDQPMGARPRGRHGSRSWVHPRAYSVCIHPA